MLIPKPVVDRVIDFVPVIDGLVKFTTTAQKISKISNPVTATSRGIGLVVISCTGPLVAYPALCALWLTYSGFGIATGNPALLTAGLDFGS
jgi:hypothetical protein